MNTKSFSEIYEDMKNYVLTHQTVGKVTDMNDGSTIASILEAVARQMAGAYVAIVSNVDSYIRLFAAQQFGLTQMPGIAASGTVTFSRLIATDAAISIPAGTIVGTSSGLSYETLDTVAIEAGYTGSAASRVRCTTLGAEGNVSAAAITEIISTLSGVDAVTNSAALTGGTEEETREAFDDRFAEYVSGLGRSSAPGIRAAVLGTIGVRSCNLVEHFPPTAGYNLSIYAEDGSGSLPAPIKSSIDAVVFGDGVNNSGCKGAGVQARVLAPTISDIDVTATLAASTTIPRSYIEADLVNKITAYINSLGIGDPVQESILRDICAQQYGIIGVLSLVVAKSAPLDGAAIGRAHTITIAMENP